MKLKEFYVTLAHYLDTLDLSFPNKKSHNESQNDIMQN